MEWDAAKVLALIGVVGCVLLLLLVGMQVISWKMFWIVTILIAGFAYFVLPKMRKE